MERSKKGRGTAAATAGRSADILHATIGAEYKKKLERLVVARTASTGERYSISSLLREMIDRDFASLERKKH